MSLSLKHILILVILVNLAFVLCSKSIQLLEETEDYIKIRFILPDWKLNDVEKNNRNWKVISCPEGSYLAQEGYPLLKSFSEALGIPVDGDISITLESRSTETLSGINIMPTEKNVVHDGAVDREFYQDVNAYSRSSFYPSEFCQKGDEAFIGNRKMIPIMIFPFQYNANKKELLVTKEAILTISISGNKRHTSMVKSSSNYIDEVGDSFFLNNKTSYNWRKNKELADQTINMPRDLSTTVNELQLIINQEGIYKITYSYLKDKMQNLADSLGIMFDWDIDNVDPRFLELRDKNGPVAIHFNGEEDGGFNQNDFFEFYGDRNYGETHYQDDYTDENTYTLSLTTHWGARMAVENGGLVVSNPTYYIVPDMFQSTVHLESQNVPEKLGRSWSLNSNFYREDVWFWKKITAPNLEIIPFELQYPKDTTIRTFSTKAALYGLTYMDNLTINQYDHKATIRLNQSLINTKEWRDQTECIFTNEEPLPNSYLNHGTNYYYISLSGETPMGNREQIMLDYIDLTYWREYKTSQDYIKFTKPSFRPYGLYQFQLQGFTTNQVSLYKIGSSVFNNMQIEPFTQSGGQPWTVTFQDSVVSQDVKYYAVTENNKKLPKDIIANIPSYLHNRDNSADCLIITARQFIQEDGTLLYKQQWENLGYTVKIIDVQDIFDEYNNGIRSAQSIKDFLAYAYNNWQDPQLKSVLLLGDGTDDERDNSNSRKYNIIPVKKIWTYQHGATAADNWYGCLVGSDPIPDISISRINIWKKEQLPIVAEKTRHYLEEPNFDDLWHSHVILSTGGKSSDTDDIFSQQSEVIRNNKIPKYYRASRVYTNTQTVSQDFYGLTPSLISKINEGAVYLQFMGHGGGRIWADYNLFNFDNITSLNNDNYPIVTSLACYCSAFDTDGAASISEALILEPEKGAIATIGFTGLGYLYNDLDFGIALNEALFEHNFNSLGEAISYTKAKFYVATTSIAAQLALTQGCALLGDPNIRVIKPTPNVSVRPNNSNYAVGDTLRLTASFPSAAVAARTYILKTSETTENPPNQNVVLNGSYNFNYTLPGEADAQYQRKVYVSGYSSNGEFCGFNDISVGRGLLANLGTVPVLPDWRDSVYFKVRISGIDSFSSLICKVRIDTLSENPITISIPMIRTASDTTVYKSAYAVPPKTTGKEVFYKYIAVHNTKETTESLQNSYVVAGPELLVEDIKFVPEHDRLGIMALIRNVGNSESVETNLQLLAYQAGVDPDTLHERRFLPLNINESRWEYVLIDTLYNNEVAFQVRVNIPAEFPEWSYFESNNYLTLVLPMNYQFVTNTGGILSSLDTNLTCEIPANLVAPPSSSIFYIKALDPVTPNAQPDVSNLVLRSGVNSTPYEITTLDSTLVDSTGVLISGNKFKLTFYYNDNDEYTHQYENENSYMIYRWNPEYKKWLLQGGNISVVDNKVVFEVSRTGIYSLFRNKDRIRPSIDVNVQDQEFTVGGYVSGTGTISLLLSDANGIDVIDNSIKLFLDGVLIPEDQWVKTVNPQDINRIPIKYQLNLQKGLYTLVVDCRDVNGNFNSRDIQFTVNDEFDVIRLANYPNPVLGKTQDPKNAGRTRFTYVLTDDADEVQIKIFTVSGRLVKTFRNLPTGVGYHEYPRTVYAWDCTDESGFYLANGVYFYRMIAKKGNKTIDRLQKLAILK